jgi:hypothetical protein
LPFRELSSKCDGFPEVRQKPGAYWHISVKDRRVEGRVGNHLDYLESLGINRGREGRGKAQALQMWFGVLSCPHFETAGNQGCIWGKKIRQ